MGQNASDDGLAFIARHVIGNSLTPETWVQSALDDAGGEHNLPGRTGVELHGRKHCGAALHCKNRGRKHENCCAGAGRWRRRRGRLGVLSQAQSRRRIRGLCGDPGRQLPHRRLAALRAE
jgi:hypothetical protein